MNPRSGHLLRILGVAFGWAVTVGNTIGAGILRAPGEVAQAVPSYLPFFLVWTAGGLYALLGALSLAELGAMIPQSGGQTVFVRRAFGAYPGFAVAWSDWLSTCASAAAVTIVLVEAIGGLLPAVSPAHALLGAIIMLVFAAAQWHGIREGSAVQVITSVLKGGAFAALIVVCFLMRAEHSGAVPAGAVSAAGIVIALQAMIFTYDGWAGVLYFSGEMKEPGRDIPRSMFMGVVSVLAIYLLVNAAFLSVIPLAEMAGDPLVADTVAQHVFGRGGTALLRVLIAVSLLSAINASMLMAPRILYATGIERVNPGGTPTHALAISTVVTLVLVVTGTFNQIIAMAAFFFVANYSASFAAVFQLRRREPGLPRPYRAWGFPVTTAFVLAGSLAFLIAVVVADPRTSAFAVLLLALTIPIHRFLKLRAS
ncbi:MAG: APC family permease [Gemmatimonadota bacterium]